MEGINKVKVKLNCEDGKYLLKFNLSETKVVDLYDDNIQQLKELFIQIMNDLIKEDFKLDLIISEEARKGDNQLACDVASTYIEELNDEIEELINSENLKIVRDNSMRN